MPDKKDIFILAVDDDDTILEIYESGLSEYTLKTFDNPLKAKEFILNSDKLPNVILMDIMMPQMDGIALMNEIHSEEKTKNIPIIAVSGLNDAATLNDALLFGAIDYLVKPFDLAELELKIKKSAEHHKEKRA